MLVEQQLRDLRRALQRLAAAVMWRDGVPMPQVVKGTLDATVPQIMEELQERISERMHEQVVDASVPVTVHQPGDQASGEFPQIYCIDKVVDMPLVMQRQVPQYSDGVEDQWKSRSTR